MISSFFRSNKSSVKEQEEKERSNSDNPGKPKGQSIRDAASRNRSLSEGDIFQRQQLDTIVPASWDAEDDSPSPHTGSCRDSPRLSDASDVETAADDFSATAASSRSKKSRSHSHRRRARRELSVTSCDPSYTEFLSAEQKSLWALIKAEKAKQHAIKAQIQEVRDKLTAEQSNLASEEKLRRKFQNKLALLNETIEKEIIVRTEQALSQPDNDQ